MNLRRFGAWGGVVRGLIYGVLAAAILLASLFVFARTWPPLVVVETGSMQANNETSFLGVADIGDVILVQAAAPGDVVTYVEGRARGHRTYGDFGDVIVFQRPTHAQAVLHRPILRLFWNPMLGGFDVPSLLELERGVDWDSTLSSPYGLRAGDSILLYNVTSRTITVSIAMAGFSREIVASRCVLENPCYVTMGDNNAPVHDQFLIRHSWVAGRAFGELPWVGLLKLGLEGTYGWGDPRVPGNSWTFLAIALAALISSSIGLELVRSRRSREQGLPDSGDEGGLGNVLSRLEEKWSRSEDLKDEKTAGDDTGDQTEGAHGKEDDVRFQRR